MYMGLNVHIHSIQQLLPLLRNSGNTRRSVLRGMWESTCRRCNSATAPTCGRLPKARSCHFHRRTHPWWCMADYQSARTQTFPNMVANAVWADLGRGAFRRSSLVGKIPVWRSIPLGVHGLWMGCWLAVLGYDLLDRFGRSSGKSVPRLAFRNFKIKPVASGTWCSGLPWRHCSVHSKFCCRIRPSICCNLYGSRAQGFDQRGLGRWTVSESYCTSCGAIMTSKRFCASCGKGQVIKPPVAPPPIVPVAPTVLVAPPIAQSPSAPVKETASPTKPRHCTACGALMGGTRFCSACGREQVGAPQVTRPQVPTKAAVAPPPTPRPKAAPTQLPERQLRCVDCGSPIDAGLVCARCANKALVSSPLTPTSSYSGATTAAPE